MKIKITPQKKLPGFGGLNLIALEEDGWRRDKVVDAEVSTTGVTASWSHNGGLMTRTLYPGEYVVVED